VTIDLFGRCDRLSLARASVALVPLAIAMIPIAAQAEAQGQAQSEAAAQEDAPTSGDIVVTAQRRSESMMTVPVAISAFSGDTASCRLDWERRSRRPWRPIGMVKREQHQVTFSKRVCFRV
jgi:hypothetical protein